MRILVVDDMEDRHDFFRQAYNGMDDIIVQAYDYDNAILELSSTPTAFDLMFLDHDLTEEATLCDPHNTFEKTGSDIAKYIAREIDPESCVGMEIYCHSMNKRGRENMVDILKKAGFTVIDLAFWNMKFDIP
jgi:CheY-like chemotaxis protein